MKTRIFLGMILVCGVLIGCGGKPSPPSEAQLKAMNDKMKNDMQGMTLPVKLGNPNDPMKGMNTKK
jgi:ABC-type transport system substrate-binding protein